MAIEITPLGFQKPDGNESVRNGDNVISANGAKAEELHQDARGRLTAIELKNSTQDGRLGSIEAKDATQDARLANLDNAAGFTGDPLALNDAAVAETLKNGAATSDALDISLDEKVPPVVAASIADSPTVANAAAAAVTSAAANLDIARRADPGMPGPQGVDAIYVEVTTDAAGTVTRGTMLDGTQHLPSAKIDRGVMAGEVKQQVDSTSYSRATVDATGVIAEPMAIGPDGCTPAWVLQRWADRMAPMLGPALGLVPYPKIAAFGDSMTNGYLGGGPTYPIALASALGVEVQNFGIPSQTSHEIALRQGGLQPALTVTGNSIPASGAVAVTTITPSDTWRSGFAWSFNGTLAGIDGTLTKATDNTWTFTRTASGTATVCPPGTVFIVATEKPYDSWIQILWSGRNNVNTAVVKADTDAMVANLTPQNKQFLILSVFNGQNEPSGSSGYNNVAAVNAALAAAYPNNYVDLRAWIISSGLAAAGISPTAADTTAISEDRIPPSLMVDNLHLTGTGYTIVGTYLATVIRAKGYIK